MLFLQAEPIHRTKPVFPNLSTIDIWGHMILHHGPCLVYFRILSNIPGLCLLGASSTLLASRVNQKRLQDMVSKIPGGRHGNTIIPC